MRVSYRKKKVRIIIVSAFLLALFLGGWALAQPSTPDTEISYPKIPGIPSLPLKPLLPEFIQYIYNFSIIISGLVAFASLVYGGFRYMTSVGSPVAMADAKEQITAGVIGLIILLGSYLLLTTINPQLSIFRLSLSPKSCDCGIPLAGQPDYCKNVCKDVPGINYPAISYTSYEIPIGTLIERLLNEDRMNAISDTAAEIKDLAEEVQNEAHDMADELNKCNCSHLNPNASSCPPGGPCPADHCEGDPCPGSNFPAAKSELLAAANNLKNYIEGEPLTLIDTMGKDITRLTVGRDLIRESIAPINYDNYLEVKELALAQGEEMKIVPFYAIGETIKATKNDPVTFYISEEEFLSAQEALSAAFSGGLGPNTLTTCDKCEIKMDYTDITIDPSIKDTLASEYPGGKIKSACPEGKDCWDYVIDWAKSHGWNPVFILSLWGEESAFSREGVALGCLIGSYGDDIVSQLACFEEIVGNCAGFCGVDSGGDPITPFCTFMRCYSGGASCTLSNNPNFFRNLFYFYSRIIPPDSPAIPSGECTASVDPLPPGLAGCPLNPTLDEFCITCNWGGYVRDDGYVHDGIDLNSNIGRPVYAVSEGIISALNGDGKGNYLLLHTSYGVFMYAHLDSFVGLTVGASRPVTKGELIGYSGCTGTSPCAPHLHFAYYVDSTITSSNARPVECIGIECIDEAMATIESDGCRLCNPFAGCPQLF